MSLPYMEFYVKDYLSKTSHLTDAEHGRYLRLLCLCWITPKCSIPEDSGWIKRRLGECDFQSILNEFFTLKKGRYFNEKQMEVFRNSNKRHLQRKRAGKKGGNAKARKTKDNISSKATVLPAAKTKQPSSNQNHNQNHIKKKSIKEKCLPENFPNEENKEKALTYWKQKDFEGDVDAEALRFRAHHTDLKTLARSWPCSWTTWYTNAPKYHKPDRPTETDFPISSISYSEFAGIARANGNGWDVNKIGDAFRPWAKEHPGCCGESLTKAFTNFCKTFGESRGKAA